MADLYTGTVRPKMAFWQLKEGDRPGTLLWAARFRLRVMEEGLGEEFQLLQLGRTLPACTCVGIHPGRVEPAASIALNTSRTEALQARRSCASSL